MPPPVPPPRAGGGRLSTADRGGLDLAPLDLLALLGDVVVVVVVVEVLTTGRVRAVTVATARHDTVDDVVVGVMLALCDVISSDEISM